MLNIEAKKMGMIDRSFIAVAAVHFEMIRKSKLLSMKEVLDKNFQKILKLFCTGCPKSAVRGGKLKNKVPTFLAFFKIS